MCKMSYHSIGEAPLSFARSGNVARDNVTKGMDGTAAFYVNVKISARMCEYSQ